MMRMRKNTITLKRAFLVFTILMLLVACFAGCSQEGTRTTEGDAESSFRKKMADASVTKIAVKKDLVLEAPVEVKGTKVLYGKGSITAVGDDWAGDEYMIVVPSDAQLTVKGSVSINADGIAGGIRAAQGAVWSIEESACVKNASAKAANTLVEGVFQMNGGTLSGAMGHNVHNKGEVTVSAGEIVGSGSKYAGIYNEGTLTQNGGTVKEAYNNVTVLSGNFLLNGGNNQNSIRDGIFVAEGAKLSVTAKEVTVTGSGARGIYLCGEAVIDNITLEKSTDSLVKIGRTGFLKLNDGTLADAGYHSIENAGKLVMTGGSVRNSYNCGIVNSGQLEITGGSFLDNVKNKAVLNKHDGNAVISGDAVMFSGNRFAIGNEDTATLDLSGAEILLTTGTNIYAYDGTVNIHDIALGATGSNNVRIYKAEVTMNNVEILGNSKTGSSTTHGILLEGGALKATDVTIKSTTGYGIRNKGGEVVAENLLISKSLKAGGINNTLQDHTGKPGVMTVNNLTVEEIRYNNIVVDGGTLTVNHGELKASGTNNTKITGGTLQLKDVTIHGNRPDVDGTNHAVYSTGGTLVAENVKITGAKVTGLRVNGETAVIRGSNVTISNSPKYGIDLTVGQINISGLTMTGNHYNITNNGGHIQLSNSNLGATVSNNVRMSKGTIDLRNVVIKGHTSDHPNSVHALFLDNGKLTGKQITVQNVATAGLRVKGGTASIQGFTVEDAGGDGVWIDGGKATITDLVVKKAGVSGVAATKTADITVTGGSIQNTVSHGAKSEGEAKLKLENISVAIATTNGRHAVLAQGGDVELNDVTITGLADNTNGFGLRINRDTSHVSGKGLHISNVNTGISATAGSADISGVTTQNITAHSVYASTAAKLVISDSELGKTGTNNVKAENKGQITLNNTVIQGTVKNHGLIVENSGHIYGKDITVRDTAGAAVRVKCTADGSFVEIDGLVTENIGTQNIYINKDADAGNVGGVVVANGDFCRTAGHSILAEAGNLTLIDTTVQGHKSGSANNVHAVYVCSKVQKVSLEGVTVLDAAGDALRISAGEVVTTDFTSQKTGRHGIWADGGKLTAQNTTLSGSSQMGVQITGGTAVLDGVDISGSATNIQVSNAQLTVNGYADGSKSQIGTSTADNIKATGTGVLRLNDVNVLASAKNNVVAIDGGTVYLTQSAVTGGNHSVLADLDGKVYLDTVSIASSATSGIRANKEHSYVEGKNVTIDGAKTGVSFQSGTIELTNITIRNTKDVGVSAAQSQFALNVTLSGLVTENCGTHAIYTSGAAANLTVNGATLSNDGSDHVINLNGGPMTLQDVVIHGENLASDKYELYSGAGWLTIGGELDADIHIATNPGRVIKVNKELTGKNLVIDWVNAPSGNALEFVTGDMMDASMDNICLGEIQTGAGSQFSVYKDDGKGYAELASKFIANEEQLLAALTEAQNENLSELTIQIGSGFTVSEQVTVPASIHKLTICDDGNAATGNTITYSGSTDGLFAMHNDLELTLKDISMSATEKVLLMQAGGKLTVENCVLSSTKNSVKMTGGTAVLTGVNISGGTNNILVTGGELTVNGYAAGEKSQIGTSTQDNVRVEGEGVIRLNSVNVLASAKNNVVAINGGTVHMTDSDVTGGNHSVLADKDGKVYLNKVSIANSVTSGIRANNANSVVEATDVTIDGAKTGVSFQSGTVTITNITIRNTKEVGVSVTQANANAVVTLNNLVTENCGTYAIYTSGAAAMLTVKGADLSNDGSDHVINLNGGPMTLHDVAVNGANLASGKYELYSGAGWLTIGGEMDVDIYIATNPGRVIKVNKELTGNNLVVDWKNAPTGNAFEFTTEAIMNASKDNITLGKTQTDAGKQLYYKVDGTKAVALVQAQ